MKNKTFFLLLLIITVAGDVSASTKLTSDEKKIIRYVDDNTSNQLALLEKMVNINSGTANAAGVKKTGELLRPEFERLGFKTQWFDLISPMKHTGSLVMTHPGTGKKILLLGHLDTVFPANSLFQSFTLSPDKKSATGPGVIDDKGGLVTILFALKALEQADKLKNANIKVVLTGDEELVDSPVSLSRRALTEAARESDIALGFEFSLTPDQLVTNRRGISEWTLTSKGISHHSATIFSSEAGFGAIYEVARVLDAFRSMVPDNEGLTLNPGLILGGQIVHDNSQHGAGEGSAGGQKTIIAAESRVHGDLRFLTDEQKIQAEQKMSDISAESLARTSSELRFEDIMPAMPETEANKILLAQFSEASQSFGGGKLQSVSAIGRGGADISYIAREVPASLDGLGPWGKGAHSEREVLDVESLAIVTKRTAVFICRYINNGYH